MESRALTPHPPPWEALAGLMPGPGGVEGRPALACGLPEAWEWAQLWPETRLCVNSPAGLTCLSGAVGVTRPWGGQREGPPGRGSGRSRVPSPAPVTPRANLPPLSQSAQHLSHSAHVQCPRGHPAVWKLKTFHPSDRGEWREPPGSLVEQPTSSGMRDGRQRAAGPGEREGPRRRAHARAGRPGLRCHGPPQPLAHLRPPAFHPRSGEMR